MISLLIKYYEQVHFKTKKISCQAVVRVKVMKKDTKEQKIRFMSVPVDLRI